MNLKRIANKIVATREMESKLRRLWDISIDLKSLGGILDSRTGDAINKYQGYIADEISDQQFTAALDTLKNKTLRMLKSNIAQYEKLLNDIEGTKR